MSKILLSLLLALVFTPALARKDCNELKSEIDAKIASNGVKVFATTIVDMNAPEEGGEVVGTCDGQTKKILYQRGAASSGVAVEKPASNQRQ